MSLYLCLYVFVCLSLSLTCVCRESPESADLGESGVGDLQRGSGLLQISSRRVKVTRDGEGGVKRSDRQDPLEIMILLLIMIIIVIIMILIIYQVSIMLHIPRLYVRQSSEHVQD